MSITEITKPIHDQLEKLSKTKTVKEAIATLTGDGEKPISFQKLKDLYLSANDRFKYPTFQKSETSAGNKVEHNVTVSAKGLNITQTILEEAGIKEKDVVVHWSTTIAKDKDKNPKTKYHEIRIISKSEYQNRKESHKAAIKAGKNSK